MCVRQCLFWDQSEPLALKQQDLLSLKKKLISALGHVQPVRPFDLF